MVELVGDMLMAHGSGSSRAISRSNKRKKIAIRKNCRENGRREFSRGSKPHSYGDIFCISGVFGGSRMMANVRIWGMAARVIRVVAGVIYYFL